MMVARVLRTIYASGMNGDTSDRKQLVVKEFEISTRNLTGMSFAAEDAVGVAEGDLILCSASGDRLIAVGVIETIKLVGTNVYERGSGRDTPEETFKKAITQQEETGYGKTGTGHGRDQRLGGCN